MIEHINDVAAGWWSWTFPMLWQTALLAGFVWALDLLLRRRGWPQVRYALWLLVFARLLVPPSFALPTSLSARLIAVSGSRISAAQPAAPAVAAPVESEPVAAPPAPMQPVVQAPTALATASPALSGKAWAMLASFGVSALLFVWLAVKLFRLRRLAIRESQRRPVPAWIEERLARLAAQFHLRRLPRIAATAEVPSAAVCGVFRPMLFLPESSLALPPEQMEHVLLHELAHVKRRDLLVNAAQSVLHILYWFNPVLWFAGRQLRHLREICCDATVGNLLRERTGEYSQTLIELADRTLNSNVAPSLGLLGLFESPSRLRQRIEYLRRPTWKYRQLRWIAAVGAAAALLLCIVPMGVVKAAPQEMPNAPTSGSTTEPQVQRREVNKPVSAFPLEVDLSTPESACAAFIRASARLDENAMLGLSWVQWDAGEDERAMKRTGQDDLAIYNKAQLDAEILDVLTYRNDLAEVITRLEFPAGVGSKPFSTRFFGCVDGKWKNLGEDRRSSLEDARSTFERIKDNIWTYFEGLRKEPGESVGVKQPLPPTTRHFVRIVVSKDAMTFEGKPTTWDELPSLLAKVPDRRHTVLQLAWATDQITLAEFGQLRAGDLAQQFDFEYLSLIGMHPLGTKAGDESSVAPNSAPTANDAAKFELMGRVEDFFAHNYRDITARKTIEWGDVTTDEKGNRSIRYKYLATIRGKDKIISNEIYTFDAEGKFVSVKKVEGFPQKEISEPVDTGTQDGLKKLVEKFFSQNFRDITTRETVEWGAREVLPNGNLSIRYKYNATIWNKDHQVMNQVFIFDSKGEFVSWKNVEGFPQAK